MTAARFGWLMPLAVSLVLKAFLASQDAVINSDGVVYLQAARMMAEGHLVQSLRLYPMPAYPLLITAVHAIGPDWILAAKLIGVIAASAVTIPVHALTALLFDRRAAFYAAMAVAILPSLNDIAPDVIRDPCFLLFACGSVAWMARACATQRVRGVLGALILAGAALLFRIEAVSLFMVYLAYLTGLTAFTPDQRRFAAKALLLLMVPALLGMVGLIAVGATAHGVDRIDQLRAIGHHILSGRFFERYQDIYAYLKTSERLSPLPSGELYKLARNYMPLLFVIGMLEAFLKSLFLPYAAALWVARRSLAARGMPLVALTILFHSLVVFLYFLHIDYLSKRYLLFCALLAMPMVGQGAVMLEARSRARKGGQIWLALLGIVFVLMPLYRSIGQGFGEDKTIAMTGEWLSGHPEWQQAEWAVDDLRYYLYADKPFDFLKEKQDAFKIGLLFQEKDYAAVEDVAHRAGKALIIVRSKKRDLAAENAFKTLRTLKQIEGPHSVVTIYAVPRRLKDASGPTEDIAK